MRSKRNGRAGSGPPADVSNRSTASPPYLLQLFSWAAIALVFVPALLGTFYMLLMAFSGGEGPLQAFTVLFQVPGIATSIGLSLWIGLVATAFSVLVTALFFAAFAHTRLISVLSGLIRPLLAIPHAAAAFGMLFLVAPSGFLMRLATPVTGFVHPPDWLLVNDSAGLSLAAGLALKEVPFLFFVVLAALPQIDRRLTVTAATLGYGRIWGFTLSAFPSLYAQIRLPIIAVIAYSTSSVDMAMILGPQLPPVLSVQILRLMNDPDLSLRTAAAAGAIVQLGVTALAIGLWLLAEKAVARLFRDLATRGIRLRADGAVRSAILIVAAWTFLVTYIGLVLLLLWSVAATWRFPDLFPSRFTLDGWTAPGSDLIELVWRSAALGIVSALAGTLMAVGALELEYRRGRVIGRGGWLSLYLPLLLPQIVFVSGLSFLFLRLGWDANFLAVAAVHLVFVFPYVYLTLAAPWHHFDNRYLDIARSLGKSPLMALVRIRLPILLAPLLTAAALGFAVSIAQYLPTLLIGAGRLPTLTTEAVALSSGGNRRLIGVYALLQAFLPFVIFALAGLIPRLVWRNRLGLVSAVREPSRQSA
ncbi:MAG: ABC transporter permease subunit [Hyphomicrobiaceae bacterium]|nr:ABC transporter permease subunit [Hyphomicrobiaceae bacterium]MCC0022717.1 ABC transporter permease subunit [Hyphomicrobiaceae bacterium]